MGTFKCKMQLTNKSGERTLELDAVVDTGASFTIVPSRLLRELGVQPFGKVNLLLANDRTMVCDLGEAVATVDGRSLSTLVAFGPEDDAPPLLGAYTLEGLRLAVDPAAMRLIPSTCYA